MGGFFVSKPRIQNRCNKKGERYEKDYYIFNGLKAISIDETESRDDCIEFTLNEEASEIS